MFDAFFGIHLQKLMELILIELDIGLFFFITCGNDVQNHSSLHKNTKDPLLYQLRQVHELQSLHNLVNNINRISNFLFMF